MFEQPSPEELLGGDITVVARNGYCQLFQADKGAHTMWVVMGCRRNIAISPTTPVPQSFLGSMSEIACLRQVGSLAPQLTQTRRDLSTAHVVWR